MGRRDRQSCTLRCESEIGRVRSSEMGTHCMPSEIQGAGLCTLPNCAELVSASTSVGCPPWLANTTDSCHQWAHMYPHMYPHVSKLYPHAALLSTGGVPHMCTVKGQGTELQSSEELRNRAKYAFGACWTECSSVDTQEAECGGAGQRPNTAAGHFNICILHSADKLWIALLRIVERKEQVAVWRSSLPVIVTSSPPCTQSSTPFGFVCFSRFYQLFLISGMWDRLDSDPLPPGINQPTQVKPQELMINSNGEKISWQ